MTAIPNRLFSSCRALHDLEMPENVVTVGSYAFNECQALPVEVLSEVLSEGLTQIGDSAFTYCDAFDHIVIPGSVTSIGNYAFQKCESLTSIIIPNSVTTIGNNAFSSSGLTSVIIPSSVTSIGREAFGACYSMSKVLVMAGESPSTLGEIPFYFTIIYNVLN